MKYFERKIEHGPRRGRTEASTDGGANWTRLLPVSFTKENAQKCFDRTKTQTRRLLNPQPPAEFDSVTTLIDGRTSFHNGNGKQWPVNRTNEFKWLLPRYRVGDVLWIQEPWRVHEILDFVRPQMLPQTASVNYGGFKYSECGKLRPARFMPLRFARPARYLVTAVKCERVNKISEEDAEKEGCAPNNYTEANQKGEYLSAKNRFMVLWNSIHGDKPGTRFEDGPWTFAYTFERIL